jgi:hypothetical protein
MPYSSVNNPKRWREQAEECRAYADAMTDAEAKRAMIEVATAYDRLAQRMEEAQMADGE